MLTQASGLDPAIHPMHKALVLVQALAQSGIEPDRALAGSGLAPADLVNPAARMSARQLLVVCRNCLALSADPLFALKAGRRIHATHLGFFGFALLCAATSRDGMESLQRYRALSTPIIGVGFEEQPERCVLSYFDSLDLDEALFRFVLDFQMGTARTLMQDTMGDGFALHSVRVSYPEGDDTGEREGLLEAPIFFGCQENQLIWDSAWLDVPQPYASSLTASMVRETCDQLLASAITESGTAGAVARILEAQTAQFPGLEAVAQRLHMSSRPLRRKLVSEGTSYADISASVRKRLAIRYLRATQMKTEEIAESLGFSDVANFRHAFRRWTQRSPGDFRPRNRRGTAG